MSTSRLYFCNGWFIPLKKVHLFVNCSVQRRWSEGIRLFRLGELFSGPGGLACGAIKADIGKDDFRIFHAWANDFDEYACATYRKNICKNENAKSVICGDVRELIIDKDHLGEIDAFAFGFPCNDFSVVGEQKGFKGNYGPLYSYGVKVLQVFQPQWFLAENVNGLSSANDGEAFKKIMQDLHDTGYRIYPHLYKFEQYGVPQKRHRIIIVGIREDICLKLPFEFRPPSPVPYKDCDVSVEKALANIPVNATNNEIPLTTEKVKARLSHIKPGQNAFNAELPEELRLNVKGAKISQIYRRLEADKPSYTVTGSGGGGTHIYHYKELRALTNRERARLQTFDDSYEFVGSKERVRKQIGMAVPPRGAQIIFEAVLRTFAGESYESIDCNIPFEN